MRELLMATQMRAIEQDAVETGAVTGIELMERAGRGVVEAIQTAWPDGAHRAVVLCGHGNNGGDGFVVARLLAQAGWAVEVFLYGTADALSGDARANHARWIAMGPVGAWADCTSGRWLPDPDVGYPVVVDAVFGIGLSRPVPDDVRDVLMATLNCRRVAVNVPSILSADTGRVMARWGADIAAAHLTVTFHRAKLGHMLAEGPQHCGVVQVVDIGLEAFVPSADPGAGDPAVTHVTREGLPDLRKRAGHKFDHGHVLVLSGGPGRTGAARLAARGALRIGAGLVTLGVPPSAQTEVASQITALMLARVADAAALGVVLRDARISALCLGPGLGVDKHAAALVAAVLGAPRMRLARPVVLDADVLTLIAADAALADALHDGCVLTPHAGEFARLFPDLAQRLADDPLFSKADATRAAAARRGAVVLFKGPDTVIAHPDGRMSLHVARSDRAAPWLATAGAGDVLAGFITGLLGRGFDPMAACEAAAWLHVECARTFGPGLIAEDLSEVLPQVLRDLGA